MQLGRDFVYALNQIADERGLDPALIVSSLEAALISAYKKYQGGNQEAEVHINLETGDVVVDELRTVVDDLTASSGELESPDTQITLGDARRLGFKDAAVGDVLHIEKNPVDFGRIAAQTARQVIIQRLKDAERQVIYSEFSDRVGEMMNGVIFKTENDQVLVRLGERTEAILPRKERIPGEDYSPGKVMKFYVLDVRQMTRGPRIVVSRTHPGLLRKLMELEIPEDMTCIEIPETLWAKFRCKDNSAEEIQKMRRFIFGEWLLDTDEYDLIAEYNIECYNLPSEDGKGFYSEIWLPVQRRAEK